MVFDKKRATATFSDWLNDRLQANGIPERGRAPWLAKRYKVSITAARKWISGIGMPDMPQFMVLVHDFGMQPAVPNDPFSAALAVLPSDRRLREADKHPYPLATDSYVRIPLLSPILSGGNGMNDRTQAAEKHDIVEHLDIARWWAETHLPVPTSRVKLLISKDGSNAPLINDGDIVFVDTERTQFDGEGFYVFDWQGVPVIRRLVPDLRGSGLRIESGSPGSPPEFVSIRDLAAMQVSGRVVAWYTLRRN